MLRGFSPFIKRETCTMKRFFTGTIAMIVFLFSVFFLLSQRSFIELNEFSENHIIGGQSPGIILGFDCSNFVDCPTCTEFGACTFVTLPLTKATFCWPSPIQPPGTGHFGCEFPENHQWRCKAVWSNKLKVCFNLKKSECGRGLAPQCNRVKIDECKPGPCGVEYITGLIFCKACK